MVHIHTSPIFILLADRSFILDNGPSLLASLGISSLLFMGWYYAIELPIQRREKKSWLSDNTNLLRQYLIVKHLIARLGYQFSVCERCTNDKMQLWNYQPKELLVVRCRCCKMNYTFTKNYCELIPLILAELHGAHSLINTLTAKRDKVLGKFLIRKLSVDSSCLRSGVSALGVFHFMARKPYLPETKAVMEIVLTEWEEVKGYDLQVFNGALVCEQ